MFVLRFETRNEGGGVAPLPATRIWIRDVPLHLGPTLGPTHFTKTINDQGIFEEHPERDFFWPST